MHLPVEQAMSIIKEGNVTVGWTRIRVQSLEPKEIQCFKCLEYGHTRNYCNSTQDRSKICYNCGTEGHRAKQCKGEPSCPICDKAVEKHRMGSRKCRSLINARKKQEERWIVNA